MNLSIPKWIYLNPHDHFNSSNTWENTFLDNPDTYDYEWFRVLFFFLKNINHPHFRGGGEVFFKLQEILHWKIYLLFLSLNKQNLYFHNISTPK